MTEVRGPLRTYKYLCVTLTDLSMKGGKKGSSASIISKTLVRCRSQLGGGSPCSRGWFSVYVGPQGEKFLARTEWLSHPLFLELLNQAETEYGYAKEGPLKLPCDVEVFHRVLGEVAWPSPGCNFARSPSRCSYQLLGVVEAAGK